MTFSRKRIDVQFSLANGNFGSGGGGNSASITGHRVLAAINKPGGSDMVSLQCAIYGLPLSTMNQLTTMGYQYYLYNKNTITVTAYEEGASPATVFKGTVAECYADMRAMPQACLQVTALGGLYEAVAPAPATSVQGSADVSKVMGQIAQQAGLQFEDNGVNVKVMNPYLWGSARQQMLRLAKAGGIKWIIDNGTLAIWPRNQPRKGGGTLISPQTGMFGYPAYTQAGVEVKTLFNPAIQYGQTVQVQSDLTPACGTWEVINLYHSLQSETPRGDWFTILTLSRYGNGGGGGSSLGE